MKSIEKIFKWIWKNKEWLFSGVGITLLSIFFAMFFKKSSTDISNGFNVSDTSDQNNGNYMEFHGTNNGNIYQNSTINNYGSEENYDVKPQIIMSESKYLEYLQSNVEGNIVFHYYDDYDGDGDCEMFALVGEMVDNGGFYEEENICGKIWFVDQNGIMEVESEEIEYWSNPRAFSVDNKTFVAFEKYYTTGSLTYLWGVINEKPYQPNISGKGNGLYINEFNEIEITDSEYDLAFDKSLNFSLGHTWKKYYFYFDGNSFREYGGISIKVEDLLRISGVDIVVNEIYNNLYVIDSIYYRSNGMININISKEDDHEIVYYNITLRCNGDSWEYVMSEFGNNYGEGIYLKELIPSSATYPDKYPY